MAIRLRTSIFFWVVVAAVLPLIGVVVVAVTYSERQFVREVDGEVTSVLDSQIGNIRRRLLIEHDLISGLADLPAMRDYEPVLVEHERGRVHPEFQERSHRLNLFLESFQTVMPAIHTVRVLDLEGNTLVKVRDGRRRAPRLDGLGAVPYVEDAPFDEDFQARLQSLRKDEVATLVLPFGPATDVGDAATPVLNTAIALYRGEERVGYFTISPPLGPLYRILEVGPRPYDGALLVAEIAPGNEARDGLIIYQDGASGEWFDGVSTSPRLAEMSPALYEAGFSGTSGVLVDETTGTRTYYSTFLPYPDRLISWVVALRVESADFIAPFQQIRYGVAVSLVLALLLSLLLAQYGARHIARPVGNLADSLCSYAGGRRAHRATPAGPLEIQRVAIAFNRMADSLERAEKERDEAQKETYRSAKLASLGQMAAGIGHEINNPLNTILSLTRLMEREIPDSAPDLRDDLQSLREETQRVSRTVEAIMNLSRQMRAEPVRFHVSQWVRDSVALVERERAEKGVRITQVIEDEYQYEGDPELLQQVLRNLLLNAVQASPENGKVSVVAGADEENLLIEVKDQGEGLDKIVAGKVFDPFFTTKSAGQGSGLGLSICLGIVQRHGGSLTLKNRGGGGAVAHLTLPLRKPDRNVERDLEMTSGL